MSCAALIPARYASTRLPAKALLQETGKYLVQHVYEQVAKAVRIREIIVATDDERIVEAVESFGGRAVMTSAAHRSGSDRVAEAAAGLDAELILNVQGDEPEIDPDLLDRIAGFLAEHPATPICTAAVPINDPAVFLDPNTVKVVIGRSAGSAGGLPSPGSAGSAADLVSLEGGIEHGRALYFSRAAIPHGGQPYGVRSGEIQLPQPLQHIGIYGFQREALFAFTSLPRVPLERAERLEQLRALHYGMQIEVLVTAKSPQGIDTPEDYRTFVARHNQHRSREGDRE